jgi:hypothetical protein
LMYEVKNEQNPRAVLERAVGARRKLETLMTTSESWELGAGSSE